MTPAHLLPLSALHDAAPGVLCVVFGPDGDFEGAPPWCGPIAVLRPIRLAGETFQWGYIVSVDPKAITDRGFWYRGGGPVVPWDALGLDLRLPSVRRRLEHLCARALGMVAPDALPDDETADPSTPYPARLARLTLALAPQIAALRGGR